MPTPDIHQIAIAHAIDDRELLRAHASRTIARQVDLLTDGLHALRNGSPHVTEEFLERAIVALTAEVSHLRQMHK